MSDGCLQKARYWVSLRVGRTFYGRIVLINEVTLYQLNRQA